MKPWHVGPVPQTGDLALVAAFRTHLCEVKAAGGIGFKLDGFENKAGTSGLNLQALLQLRTLVLALCKAQPKARFKVTAASTYLLVGFAIISCRIGPGFLLPKLWVKRQAYPK